MRDRRPTSVKSFGASTLQVEQGREHQLDQRCIDTIRALSMDAVERASSGHPGAPMGLAPAAYVLWTRFLKHNPANPEWPDRDRFVLSCGHASMLLYSLLHLTGYGLTLEELQRFRQWRSCTPGHPERGVTPGVETTTGPLGQGVANAVGMAIAERYLAERFNRPGHTVVDHSVWGLCSDGDLMEGVASEAASLAGHLRLGKLNFIYDDNGITIEGETSLSFTESVARRFDAYGWQVQTVPDGNDVDAIAHALEAARRETGRPSLILLRTRIGDPAPHKRGTADAHGAPLGAEEVRLTKQVMGWPQEPAFVVPDDVRRHMLRARDRGQGAEADWRERWNEFAAADPLAAAELERWLDGRLPDGWERALPTFSPADGAVATRSASGITLNAIAPAQPELIGGSADLAPSTNTLVKGAGDFTARHAGRNLRWGVREHAMGACLNGMAAHGGVHPYGATFLVFTDYMRPAIRLGALMELPVIYVCTHDSIGLGEDGPTHQPVEHLASLRAIPNLVVLRPADATETVEAWRVALGHRTGPVVLVLTRQKVPVIDRARFAPSSGVARGAYVLADPPAEPPRAILIATGSEVAVALEAWERLAREGLPTRVVSMPSWELFERQPRAYRDAVLPPSLRARVAVEAGSPMGWGRYVTDEGDTLTLDRFGASAPGSVLRRELGFTAETVVDKVKRLLEGERPPSSTR